MIHTNGHLLCAVDVETTGTDISQHEVYQVAILPLDYQLEPIKEIIPFYINIRPERVDNIDPNALLIGKKKLVDIINHSMDRYHAAELLDSWFHDLNLPCTTATQKKIMPLWSNGSFDKKFLIKWLDQELYDSYFYFHERDTQETALAINDRFYQHGEKIPFPKVGLPYLSTCFNVVNENAHDALSDCLAASQVYKKMLTMWVPTLLGGEHKLHTDDMKSQVWDHPDESKCSLSE